ncbi:carbohydrate-binding protein [Streptosporangium sp. V21-05]|uniref:carbohydrate-binding protein n=1 Tax=Streptosporangium sp. V21-05 TaxID=3446115 RepID=UPI003F52A9F7
MRTTARILLSPPLSTLSALLLALAGVLIVAAPPAVAAATTHQAESAALSGGAVVGTDHTGYTGSGFVGGYTDVNKGRAATTFTVNATAAGARTVSLRYANGTGATMSLSLYVNGTRIRQTTLPATGDWNTWTTKAETVTLNAGANTVAYRFDGTDLGNVNLDAITVSDVTPPPAGTYEAESAALSGGAVVGTDHTGYTGSGFVGGYTDVNKGRAATTFTVNATAAGARTVSLRYANGTGATMSLSLYVNGTRIRQTTLPATGDWNTWTTKAETVTLNAGANTVAYRFDGTDLGNVNLDSITVTGATDPGDPSVNLPYQMETGFLSGGAAVATAVGGFSGTGYADGFTSVGARAVRTVNAAAAGGAVVTLRYGNATGGARTLSTYVNGLRTGRITLPAGSGWLTATQTLTLRAGLNLIGYQYDAGDTGGVALDGLSVAGGLALNARGATVPYTEYEAEGGSTNATVIGPDRTYLTVASEASGRRAVRLDDTGDYLQITLTKPANSIVVRYAVPDNASGTGITAPLALYAGGAKLQDLSLSSTYSWVYGDYPYTSDPAGGRAHHFFDEVRARFATQPAGTVLKLQKDASSTAAYYVIDLIDTEQVAAAITAPADHLAITSYGAVAGDAGDDTAAINNAVAAARAQSKGVWIPAGTFTVNARINLAGVSVRGAGQWHTTVRGTNGKGGFFATGSGVQIADLTIAGDVRYRDDANFDAGIEGNFGSGSLVHNVWMEHVKVGMWIDSGTDGLYVAGVRIRDTFADGVNMHGNVRNTRLDQSVVRNTGDDGLAMFSQGSAVTNCAYTFNTVSLPMLANAVGVYGGTGNRVEDNLLSDTVTGSSGIAISTRFSPVPFAGTTSVQRNTLTRTGGFEPNWGAQLGALWIYADTADITAPVLVKDVTIVDSTHQAILLSYQKTITNLTLDHVTVTGAGSYGIEANAAGSATASHVTVTGAASGGLNNLTGYTFTRGPGNSGW